jgi:hypothetical protein
MQTTNKPQGESERGTRQSRPIIAAIFALSSRQVDQIDWHNWSGPGRFSAAELFEVQA